MGIPALDRNQKELLQKTMQTPQISNGVQRGYLTKPPVPLRASPWMLTTRSTRATQPRIVVSDSRRGGLTLYNVVRNVLPRHQETRA